MSEPIKAVSPDLAGLVQAPPALAARAGAAPAELEKAAKGFESVLINTLLQEMGKTVEPAGLADDGTTQQVQGIFWSFLSQELANKGGLGLWKQLLRHMPAAATDAVPRGEVPRGEGILPSRPEGVPPSVSSSVSSSSSSSAAASSSFREAKAAEAAGGQDARRTQGRDALATKEALATKTTPDTEPNR